MEDLKTKIENLIRQKNELEVTIIKIAGAIEILQSMQNEEEAKKEEPKKSKK